MFSRGINKQHWVVMGESIIRSAFTAKFNFGASAQIKL